MPRIPLLAFLIAAATPAGAFEPAFPVAAAVAAAVAPARGTLRLPTGPWAEGAVPERALDGTVSRRAWRLEAPGAPTLDLLAPLLAQLEAQGWRVVFACETAACGGFDFRFAIEVLPEPGMHVDLGDFRFVAAERGAGEAVALLVSRSAAAGFVQVAAVSPLSPQALAEEAEAAAEEDAEGRPRVLPVPAPVRPAASVPVEPGRLAETLERDGHAVLDDLVFAPGSVDLANDAFASLTALAAWMAADETRRVVLVGHTDDEGGLAANIALSKRRALAVKAKLAVDFGIGAQRIEAEGVGYLSPRTTNATEEGRARNRRVEVVALTPR